MAVEEVEAISQTSYLVYLPQLKPHLQLGENLIPMEKDCQEELEPRHFVGKGFYNSHDCSYSPCVIHLIEFL